MAAAERVRGRERGRDVNLILSLLPRSLRVAAVVVVVFVAKDSHNAAP